MDQDVCFQGFFFCTCFAFATKKILLSSLPCPGFRLNGFICCIFCCILFIRCSENKQFTTGSSLKTLYECWWLWSWPKDETLFKPISTMQSLSCTHITLLITARMCTIIMTNLSHTCHSMNNTKQPHWQMWAKKKWIKIKTVFLVFGTRLNNERGISRCGFTWQRSLQRNLRLRHREKSVDCPLNYCHAYLCIFSGDILSLAKRC